MSQEGRSQSIGQRIRQARWETGLPQDAFAAKIGVGKRTITRWENSDGVPSVDALLRLSAATGLSVGWFLHGVES